MSFNFIAETTFAELSLNAETRLLAEQTIDKNFAEIQSLADYIMEMEYLVRVAPDPKDDHLLLKAAGSAAKLMKVLIAQNNKLQDSVDKLNAITNMAQPLLN